MAQHALSGAARTLAGPDQQDIRLEFSGQQAVLTGTVRSEQVRAAAEQFAEAQVRIGPPWWNGAVNPVAMVRNDVQLLPPGFMLLLRFGAQGLLAGETYDATEQEKLLAAASPLLPTPIDALLLHTAKERGQALTLEVTLKSLPSSLPPEVPVALVARLGSPVEAIDLNRPEAQLQQDFAAKGLNWELAQPLLAQLSHWAKDAAEQAHRLTLPPPHLLLLAVGEAIHLRGNLASAEMKSQVVEAAQKQYAGLEVHEEISVSEERRPVPDAGATLTTFPPAPDPRGPGTLAFAIPGEDWLAHEISPEETLQDIEFTPVKFDAKLASADHAALAVLHAEHLHALDELAAKEGWPQPFLALMVTSQLVELRGKVPTDSAKDKVLAAAAKFYDPRPLVEHLEVDAKCRPLSLTASLPALDAWPPPPGETSPGRLAFTLLTAPWTVAEVPPVQLRAEEMDEFIRLKLLPPTVSSEDFRAAFAAFTNNISTQSVRLKSMQISQRPPQPYVALLALGREIVLRGDAGSEELKKSVIAAARKFYQGREVIDELRVESDPPVVLKPGFTVKTFPPPPAVDGPGLLGFNLPGQPWLQVRLTWEQPSLESLQISGLFSKVFDPSQAWPDYEAWLPKLAARAKSPKKSR